MGKTVFNVQMSCGGCSSACSRILNKIDGVSNVEADLDKQTITVTHADSVKPEDMLEKLKKWGDNAGKSVSLQ